MPHLRNNIEEIVGGVLPLLEDEVSVRRKVTLGQKTSGRVNFGGRVFSQQPREGFLLAAGGVGRRRPGARKEAFSLLEAGPVVAVGSIDAAVDDVSRVKRLTLPPAVADFVLRNDFVVAVRPSNLIDVKEQVA